MGRRNGVAVEPIDLPLAVTLAGDGRRRAAADRRDAAARPARRCSPRPPATPTPSAGGRTSSSTAATASRRSTPSPRRWPRTRRARGTSPADSAPRGAHAPAHPRRPGRGRHGRRRLRRVARPGARPAMRRRRAADAAALRGRPQGEGRRHAGCRGRTGGCAARPGYGAGVSSPGWYAHVFRHPGPDGVSRFFVDAAHALRRDGDAASPDHLIAASRLAEDARRAARAAAAGLAEVLDAADAVLGGLPARRRRARRRRRHRRGPARAPQVPLARDLAACQRAARLKPEADAADVELDLRRRTGCPFAAAAPARGGRRAVGRARGVAARAARSARRGAWRGSPSCRSRRSSGPATARRSRRPQRRASSTGTAATRSPTPPPCSSRAAGRPDRCRRALPCGRSASWPPAPRPRELMDTLGRWPRRCVTAMCAAPTPPRCAPCSTGSSCGSSPGSPWRPRARRRRGAGDAERMSAVQAALALVDHPARHARVPGGARRARRGRRATGWCAGRATRLLHDGGHGRPTVAGAPRPGADARHAAGRRGGVRRGFPRRQRHRARPRHQLLGVVDAWVASLRADSSTPSWRCCAVRSARSSRPNVASSGGCCRPGASTAAAPMGDDVDADRVAGAWRRSGRCSASRRPAGACAGTRRHASRSASSGCRTPSGSGAGASCSAAARPTARASSCAATTRASTPPSARSYDRTAPRGPGHRSGRRPRPVGAGVARWLGDIRRYFPTPVVQVLQRDAIERLDLRRLLLEPEMLGGCEPDLHLVTMLVELNQLLPDETRATARQVVATVLAELEARLADRTRQAVRGALARAEPHPPSPSGRHRLAAHDPRQPAPLAARAPHRRARAARRVRPPPAQPRPRRRRRHRPERLDGRQRRVRLGVRGRARPAAGAAHAIVAFDTAVVDLTPCSTTPSTCCSVCSSAVAPTSAPPSATAGSSSPGPATPCWCWSATCSRAATWPCSAPGWPSWSRDGVTRARAAGARRRGRARLRPPRSGGARRTRRHRTACTPDEFPDVLAASL